MSPNAIFHSKQIKQRTSSNQIEQNNNNNNTSLGKPFRTVCRLFIEPENEIVKPSDVSTVFVLCLFTIASECNTLTPCCLPEDLRIHNSKIKQ